MSNIGPLGLLNVGASPAQRQNNNPAPILVTAIPSILINGKTTPINVPARSFTQKFAAVAAGASVTLIAASAGLFWYINTIKIWCTAGGVFELQDNGVAIALCESAANVLMEPFGPLPYGLHAQVANTALTLKNTTAGASDYSVTLIADYYAV